MVEMPKKLDKKKIQQIAVIALATLFALSFVKNILFKGKKMRRPTKGSAAVRTLPKALTAQLPKRKDIKYPRYNYAQQEGKNAFDIPSALKAKFYARETEVIPEPEPIIKEEVVVTPPPIAIKSIVWGGKSPAIIIDNNIYHIGEKTHDAEVLEIVKGGAWFLYKGKKFLIEVKE